MSIRLWLDSDRLYTVRYAMGMLMRYYLDNPFQPEYLAWVAGVHSEEYYLNMMRAWFFATALAKQPEETLPWLTERRLDAWTHNKTIQKAVESYRITPEMKQQAPPASHSYNGRQSLKGRKSGEEKECWRLWRNTSELTVNALCLSHEAQRKGKTLESSGASSVFCHHGRSGGIR